MADFVTIKKLLASNSSHGDGWETECPVIRQSWVANLAPLFTASELRASSPISLKLVFLHLQICYLNLSSTKRRLWRKMDMQVVYVGGDLKKPKRERVGKVR